MAHLMSKVKVAPNPGRVKYKDRSTSWNQKDHVCIHDKILPYCYVCRPWHFCRHTNKKGHPRRIGECSECLDMQQKLRAKIWCADKRRHPDLAALRL